jgi:hypothetical protein
MNAFKPGDCVRINKPINPIYRWNEDGKMNHMVGKTFNIKRADIGWGGSVVIYDRKHDREWTFSFDCLTMVSLRVGDSVEILNKCCSRLEVGEVHTITEIQDEDSGNPTYMIDYWSFGAKDLKLVEQSEYKWVKDHSENAFLKAQGDTECSAFDKYLVEYMKLNRSGIKVTELYKWLLKSPVRVKWLLSKGFIVKNIVQEEPLPCPFCKSTKIDTDNDCAFCRDCGAQGPDSSGMAESEEKIIKVWNKRP